MWCSWHNLLLSGRLCAVDSSSHVGFVSYWKTVVSENLNSLSIWYIVREDFERSLVILVAITDRVPTDSIHYRTQKVNLTCDLKSVLLSCAKSLLREEKMAKLNSLTWTEGSNHCPVTTEVSTERECTLKPISFLILKWVLLPPGSTPSVAQDRKVANLKAPPFNCCLAREAHRKLTAPPCCKPCQEFMEAIIKFCTTFVELYNFFHHSLPFCVSRNY